MVAMNSNVERLERDLNTLVSKREALEFKVSKLRQGSIDPDVLEEQARKILGYRAEGEWDLIIRE